MSDDVQDFLDEVDWVTNEVKGIISGKIDIEASEKKEARKKELKDLENKKKEEALKKGREGKGIKFEKYKSYCYYCSREFDLETPLCTLCNKETMTSEQRKQQLMEKVEEYKTQKAKKAENRMRWDNWKKTEAMLYKRNSTNYKKWEFFEDEDEKEPELDFIPPENDPNFIALEKDMKERGEKRKKDLIAATELKEKGNEYFKQGKYRNAIKKYEEAIEIKKDMMILYTNCAAAKLRIDDFEGSIKDCTRVIDYYEVFDKEFESNKDTVFKALIRRGDAYKALKKFNQAVFDYEKALEIKNDKFIENLLERSREEAIEFGISTITEQIEDSDLVLSQLDTHEKIQSFRVSGGYQVLFKRIYEAMDLEALKVLKALMNDENKFLYLQPLILPLYSKRQTAAVVMMETLKKYSDQPEFTRDLANILSLSIENTHIREEIAKHSAITKGKKFYVQALDLFLTNPVFIRELTPILSNLCLTKFKTVSEKKPNPSNMKSLIRYDWNSFTPVLVSMLSAHTTVALGLLCNISADKKLKILLLSEKEIINKSIHICYTSTKSLDVERSSGFLINILTHPTDPNKLQGYYNDIWKSNLRMFRLDYYTEALEERTFKLLFRLAASDETVVDKLAAETDVIEFIFIKAYGNNDDTIAKILAVGTGCKAFCAAISIDSLFAIVKSNLEKYLAGAKVDEKVGNLCLCVSRLVGNYPDASLKFTETIPSLVNVIKEKLGAVRKNVAVCLGKLCNNETNKEVMRNVHGLEVLSSVMQFINK
jgi:tetratricopeptide (TPR) repeat protein